MDQDDDDEEEEGAEKEFKAAEGREDVGEGVADGPVPSRAPALECGDGPGTQVPGPSGRCRAEGGHTECPVAPSASTAAGGAHYGEQG